jgi:hypothetical protein
MHTPTRFAALAAALVFISCSSAPPSTTCQSSADCPIGQICEASACVDPAATDCTAGQTRPCGPTAVGACRKGTQRCVDGTFETQCTGKVDAVAETCNGVDDDCDGQVDDGVGSTFTIDADGDGFGAAASGAETRVACTAPAGFVDNRGDCDDRPGVGLASHPGAPEVCDATGLDENCDGTVNEGCGCTTPGTSQPCCAGRGTQTCDLVNGGTVLSACSVQATAETCNGVDDDCNGQVDDGATTGSSDGGVTTQDGGTVNPDGTCSVGLGVCAASGVTACTAGALVCSATTGSPGTETCNALDDDCDGQVDEAGPGLCPVTGQACSGGACACPSGQSVCNGTCRQLTTEVCDGVDNDCDGQVDEALTIACAADADGDGYADGAATTQQCPNTARPQAGNCPVGFVAPASSLGADCNPANGSVYRLVASRSDADNDTYCAGAAANDCVGASALPGRRFATACPATDDCNDSNIGLYRLMASRSDADVDGYCTGAVATDCVGASPLPGRRFEPNCLLPDDCNDANATVFRLASVRTDGDNDGYCAGAAFTQCIGNAPPAGQRLAANCSGDDCRDTNSQATTTCVLAGAYATASRSQTCPNGPQSNTLIVTNFCPIGFSLSSYSAQILSGAGNCSAISPTTITQSCNFLEGTNCRIVGTCTAD